MECKNARAVFVTSVDVTPCYWSTRDLNVLILPSSLFPLIIMTDVRPTKCFFYTECAKTSERKKTIDQPAVKFSFLLSYCIYIGCVKKKKND